ncbi:hypothetical protein VNO80_24231 [Phaseolus coccineus]|uniref:Uncharacterized protein n=1 Tax=Phaseolus coccineus TaxID=3886 RepID=A0AAN9LS48_PHACN
MAFHFNQMFFLGIVIVAMVLPQEVIVAEPVTGAPLTTQSDSPPADCNTLRCSVNEDFCDACCKGQKHKSGTCTQKEHYYFCQCKD